METCETHVGIVTSQGNSGRESTLFATFFVTQNENRQSGWKFIDIVFKVYTLKYLQK
jgi:hypothetical protein